MLLTKNSKTSRSLVQSFFALGIGQHSENQTNLWKGCSKNSKLEICWADLVVKKTKHSKSLWKSKTWSNWSVSLKNWSRKSYFNIWGADLKCARHSIIERISFYLLSKINTLSTMFKLMNDDVTESRWRHGISVSFASAAKIDGTSKKTLSSIERICHSTSNLKKFRT